jgi:hypothetical protein
MNRTIRILSPQKNSVMNAKSIARFGSGMVIALALLVTLAGCSKKEEKPPEAAAADTSTIPAPPVQDTAVAQENTPAPVAINTVNTADTKAAMDAAAATLKAKQYEETAKLLLAIQAQQLNEKQAAAYRAQMLQFQGSLANAIANGDASAKAAADALRASASGAGR